MRDNGLQILFYFVADCESATTEKHRLIPSTLQCQLRLLSACCPLDVRLLSAFKADNKRTSSGQQADNNQ
jgi:hypothetical protein